MKKIIILALVLAVFMFAATTVTTTISIPKTNISDWTFSIKNVVPLGDPMPGTGVPTSGNRTGG